MTANKTLALLAFDPGKTTGSAFHNIETGETEFKQMNFLETCQYVHRKCDEWNHNITIISESFVITPNTAKNTQSPWSLELIGVFRYMSLMYCNRDLLLQTPAAAKRFSSDERLRQMDWFIKLNNRVAGHANDAARHLLLFEATRGYLSEQQLQTFALVP